MMGVLRILMSQTSMMVSPEEQSSGEKEEVEDVGSLAGAGHLFFTTLLLLLVEKW